MTFVKVYLCNRKPITIIYSRNIDYITSNHIQFYYCYNSDSMKKTPQRVPWVTLSILGGGLYQQKIIQYLKKEKLLEPKIRGCIYKLTMR